MAYELSFVDSIVSSPSTRLDLTGSGLLALADGTDFGMPELQRAYAGTLIVDGVSVPASAYGNRVITLNLEATDGFTDDQAATLVQSLARELDRPNNFLRYKPNTTNPVYFRTLRSPITSVVWDMAQRNIRATVLAEPFGYGPEEALSPVTVTNDPAAGSNGLFFDVTGVKGDVETPAILKFEGLNVGTFADIIIGTRRHGTPSSVGYFIQCENFTAQVDTSAPGNDAIMSGSSSNYLRTTFATNTAMDYRLRRDSFPGSVGSNMRGTYRLYAVVRGASTGVFSIQWSQAPDSSSSESVVSKAVTYAPTNGTLRSVIDLGQLTFPVGADPVSYGYSGVDQSLTGGSLLLQAARTSGTGNLDWDYVVLVPDDPARQDDWFTFSLFNLSTSKNVIVDGPRDMVYPQNTGASTIPAFYSIPWDGRIPRLTPNQTNRFIMLRPDVAGPDGTYGDVKGRTTTVTVSYYPRYLYVRPVST